MLAVATTLAARAPCRPSGLVTEGGIKPIFLGNLHIEAMIVEAQTLRSTHHRGVTRHRCERNTRERDIVSALAGYRFDIHLCHLRYGQAALLAVEAVIDSGALAPEDFADQRRQRG